MHYAKGKNLEEVLKDAWTAGVISRVIAPSEASDIELQRIADWLRQKQIPELSLPVS